MSLLRLAAMLVAVSAIAISCKSTPTSTPTPGPSPSTAIGACSPRNIANTPSQTAARSMDISWTNPSLGCAGSYNIVAIASNGTPKQTVKQVPSEASSAVVGGLNLCTFYRYGVQAVSPDGRKGAVVRPGHFVYESGLPNAVPPIVTIVLQGIGSSNERGDFDPAKVSYCTSPNGKEPPVNAQPALQGLDSSWLNYDVQSGGTVKTDQSTAGPGAGNNLIDSLASTGGYVLPFSYTGSTVTGTAANPMFHSPAFTSNNVAVSSIGGEQDLLETEIANVRKVWHNTKIVVIGHSNGGLIAEQWWLNHRSNLHGVTQVFSLDAPLNGVYDASKCLIGECVFGGVGQSLSESYDNLWIKQAKNDPYWVTQDNQDKVFTAVGTYGDPLYDAGDNTVTKLPTTDSHVGIISQLYFTEPDCANDRFDPYDLSTSRCQPAGRYFIDPCSSASSPLDHDHTVYGPFAYGFPGDRWMHSVVKNCPGVIQHIAGFIAKPAPPPPTIRSTVIKTFTPWVPVGQTGEMQPAPGLAVTNGGTASCDSGSADDPGSALAVRCNPPGNGTPCFINPNGDPGAPVLCSDDPTSGRAIEVTPSGTGIPVGLVNQSNPSAPLWFLILADGRRCRFLGYGTNTNIISYDCGGGIGATVPDRSHPTWTVREGKPGLNPTLSSSTIAVVTAYR